jgi:steroid 5-alpha reductase family enzyme
MLLSTFLSTLAAMAAVLSVVMAIAWATQRRTGNTGWIDAVWTFGLGTIGIAAALAHANGRDRPWLVTIMIAAWMLRLGVHIVRRSADLGDDPRYRKLIEGWSNDAAWQMFILLQKQALVSIPMAATLLLAAQNPEPLWRWLDVFAVMLFTAGLVGEAVADGQLAQCRRNSQSATRVCAHGLWAWSRHPNYFCEWVMWVSFALLALGSWPLGWLALAGPAAMYWLLTSVSGIPPLEAHMEKTRGEAYRRYQMTTSAFFPWPPRQTGGEARA